jgi:hypothetical protein
VEERVLANKSFGAIQGVTIAQRFRLADKVEPASMIAGDTGVSRLIAWPDHQTNIFDIGLENLFNQDAQDRLFSAIPINQQLQGQSALLAAGGSNNRFGNLHKRLLS